MRGPGVLPEDPGTPARRTSGERFDDLVLGIVQEIDDRWSSRLGLIEYAVEDAPQIPDNWHPETVPLSSLVRGVRGEPTRIVLFRRPIEHRAGDAADRRVMGAQHERAGEPDPGQALAAKMSLDGLPVEGEVGVLRHLRVTRRRRGAAAPGASA